MLPEILQFQLREHFGASRTRVRAGSEPLVLVDGEDQVERPAVATDVVHHGAKPESDRVEDMPLLPYFESQMILPDDPRSADHFDFPCEEDGAHVPGAVGANSFRVRRNLGVSSFNAISLSILSSGVLTSSDISSSTAMLNAFRNSSTLSSSTARPAAYLCPPNWISLSSTLFSAWWMSNPTMLRAEPRATPSIVVIMMVGR